MLAALVGRLLGGEHTRLRSALARTLRLADGTCVSKGTNWPVHGVLDLRSGGFRILNRPTNTAPRRLDRGVPIAGEFQVGDRNYARVSVLKRFLAKARGRADSPVRLGWNALQLSTPRGKASDRISCLQHLPAAVRPHEMILRAA